MEQFKKMLESMKDCDAKTIIVIDKEHLSEDAHKVYRMCKLAENDGIEIQFVKDKTNSKDIIKEYEENSMTGMKMSL